MKRRVVKIRIMGNVHFRCQEKTDPGWCLKLGLFYRFNAEVFPLENDAISGTGLAWDEATVCSISITN